VRLNTFGKSVSFWLIVPAQDDIGAWSIFLEYELSRRTEVLGENPPQRHFVHHKSHMT
jgi:hypothetical protein